MNPDIAPASDLFAGPGGSSESADPVRPARLATSTLFLVDGMTFGTWAALIPSFQQKFHLSAGQLSGVLFGLVLGALISMPLTGRLIAQWGSNRIAFPAALGFTAMLPLLALAPSYGWLVAAATLFGACKGALDVSVNAQGVTVEKAAGKPIFSSFQAFWSLGGLSAAFLLSFAMNHGFESSTLMLLMAGLLFMMTLATFGRLLAEPGPSAGPRKTARLSLPSGRLLVLGALAFLALFSEGVLLDWSAVYARTVAQVPVALAPVAFATFALCMAAGRFLGDALIVRFGPAGVLQLSGVLMTLGIAVAVGLQTWSAVLAGFATVGLGIANLVPVIFGAAGRSGSTGGTGPAIATVTTMGYFGFLSGPPVIGVLAAFAGLPVAFGMVVVFGIVLATLGAGVIRATSKETEAA